MQKRFEQVDLTALTANAMEANNAEIVELNKDQLFEGIDSKGNETRPGYTSFTRFVKQQQGKPSDRVTLKDTGEFYSKFFLRLTGDMYSIDSTDSKTPDLKEKYGSDILGLTSESKRITWQTVKPNIVQAIRNITGAR